MSKLNNYENRLIAYVNNYKEYHHPEDINEISMLFVDIENCVNDDHIISKKREELLNILLEVIEPRAYPQLIRQIYSDTIFERLMGCENDEIIKKSLKEIYEKVGSLNIVNILNNPGSRFKHANLTLNFINNFIENSGLDDFIENYKELNIREINIFELYNNEDVFKYFINEKIKYGNLNIIGNINSGFKEEFVSLKFLSNVSEIIDIFDYQNKDLMKELKTKNRFFEYYSFFDIANVYDHNSGKNPDELDKIIEKYVTKIMNNSKKTLSTIFNENIYTSTRTIEPSLFYHIMRYARNNEPSFLNEILSITEENEKDASIKNDKNHIKNKQSIYMAITKVEQEQILKVLDTESESINKNKKRI